MGSCALLSHARAALWVSLTYEHIWPLVLQMRIKYTDAHENHTHPCLKNACLCPCSASCSNTPREIIPSAYFTGPHQFKIAASLSYVVWGLMAVLSPVAWPIAKALDYILGTEVQTLLSAFLYGGCFIHHQPEYACGSMSRWSANCSHRSSMHMRYQCVNICCILVHRVSGATTELSCQRSWKCRESLQGERAMTLMKTHW